MILRNLIAFSDQGAEVFFGEPEFDTADLMRLAADGKGMVTCLELPAVQDRPKLFSTSLMWMLADLFHDLPEVGDLDKPKLVFFFVTQTPKDVPPGVLGQLGNRVQHALRAFTPEDPKALKARVSTFPHSGYDLEELLTQLGTGEAVITVLSEHGAPNAGAPALEPSGRQPNAEESMVQQVVTSSTFRSMLRSAGTVLGREITRSIFGTARRGR